MIYVVTSGDYETNIDYVIEGEVNPEHLFKQWFKDNILSKMTTTPVVWRSDFTKEEAVQCIEQNTKYHRELSELVHQYKDSQNEMFVELLIKNHGFKKIEVEEVRFSCKDCVTGLVDKNKPVAHKYF